MDLFSHYDLDFEALADADLPKDPGRRKTTSFQMSARLLDFLQKATVALNCREEFGHKYTQGQLLREALTTYLTTGQESIRSGLRARYARELKDV